MILNLKVTFSRIRYHEIVKTRQWQDQVLAKISWTILVSAFGSSALIMWLLLRRRGIDWSQLAEVPTKLKLEVLKILPSK